MNIFKKIKLFIKRKAPATFNAAEYETERILDRISRSDAVLAKLEQRISALDTRMDNISSALAGCSDKMVKADEISKELTTVKLELIQTVESCNAATVKSVDKLQACSEKGLCELRAVETAYEKRFDKSDQELRQLRQANDDIMAQLSELRNTASDDIMARLSDLRSTADNNIKHVSTRMDDINAKLKTIGDTVSRSDLNAVASCKSDTDYDNKLIPLNRYFNNRGMAISMHLTSIADKPLPIIYETADITRTAALSLVADEIKARNLDGAVAELGVAQGKFARVINAVFPDKPLHLFDTFDGFPEADIEIDKKKSFSTPKKSTYEGIDLNMVLRSMPHNERCIVHKGYFPETAEGLDEQFCFVSIDCDLYKPIHAGLEYFYPRLVKGGCIFVHDYRSKYFTGVRAALNEFAEKNGISYSVLPDNTGSAVIMK